MPWNPFDKYPEIFKNVKDKKKISYNELKFLIVKHLGVSRDATIKQHMVLMKDFSYILETENVNVYDLNWNKINKDLYYG